MFEDLQQIILYVKADSTVGEIVDEYGQSTSVSKAITRGVEALLCLRVLRDSDAYPFEQLSSFVSWDCLLDNDWNTATVPKLRADNENITVISGVLNPGTDEEKAYTEIRIPLLETDTVELGEAISGKDDVTLGLELCGFAAGRTKPAFVLQFDLPVRNRRGNAGMGSPTPVGEGNYWTTEQTKAYIQQSLDYQFSEDNEDWHEVQTVEDVYFRSRFPEGEWSEGCGIPKGKDGNNLVPSASGTLEERDIYDDELKGFVYGVPEESAIYFKLSDASGDWSPAFPIIQSQGEKGDKGDTGDTGAQGPQGEKGDKGDTGDRGLPGDTGAKGDKGDQGAKGDPGEKGDGIKIDMAGALSEKHIYDDAERGFTYLDTDNNHIYLKQSDAFGDWSDPAPGGVQGIQGEKGDKGEKGDQGNRGENAVVEPDFVFTADDVFGGSLVLEGVKTIAQIELYDAMGNGLAVKTGDPDSPVMIQTEYGNNQTVIYFGQSDVSNGGRIRFAQGISGESLYQMWLSAGNTGSEEDYLNWLRVHDGSRHEFTQDDLENKILTIDALLNVVAIADDNGTQWQLPQNAVSYGINSTVVKLAGIMAMKDITEIAGTWQLILGGGDKGERGEDGVPGADGTVEFEELTPEQVASLKGDKGDQGDAGNIGPPGPQGEQGIQGIQGVQGDSTYQVWLDSGNTGTPEDYLNWLRVQGARHDFTQDDLAGEILSVNTLMNIVAVADENGTQWQLPQNAVSYAGNSTIVDLSGIMTMKNISVISGTWQLVLAGGDKGEKGDQGDPGVDGTVAFEDLTPEQIAMLKGDKGDKGDIGDTGAQGPQGEQGIQGPQGIQGETGPAGPQGEQGIQGEQGLQGIQGIQGETGPQGDKGDTGDTGDSAYDLWIAAGNSGTEADFLSYVNGEKVRVNRQTGTSYTPVLADAGKIIEMNNADANTVNLPLYASTTFEADTVFAVDRMGAGETAISCDATAIINGVAGGTVYILTQYCGASVRVLAADNWLIQGVLD